MRIVSWNMGYGFAAHGYRKHHTAAWAFLRSELKPDLAVLQEVQGDALAADCAASRAVWVPTSAGSVTGTGIFCADGRLESLGSMDGGATVFAARYMRGAEALVVISAHIVTAGDVPTSRDHHAVLRDLVPWFTERVRGAPFLIAGDFNAMLGWTGKSYDWFFTEMESRGFREAKYEGRSYWGRHPEAPRDGAPIQDDHIFCDDVTLGRLTRCAVVDDERVTPLSDHGPVVLDLNDPAR